MDTKNLEVVLNLKDRFSGQAATSAGSANRAFAGLSKTVMGLAAAYLSLRTAQAIGRWFIESTRLAQIQEQAVISLNAALQATGNYSEEAAQGLQAYASELQASLGIGDEVTLQTLSMVEGLTRLSAEALPKAMQAVIQISNLYNVDYQNAALLLGKTLTSQMNAFSRYGIQVDLAGDAQERLNQIIEGTAPGMAIAEAKANTYEGAINRLTNSYGDLRESVGMTITQSPKLVEGLNFLAEEFSILSGQVDNARDAHIDLVGSGFQAVGNGVIHLMQFLNMAVGGFVTLEGAAISAALGIVMAWRDIAKATANVLGGIPFFGNMQSRAVSGVIAADEIIGGLTGALAGVGSQALSVANNMIYLNGAQDDFNARMANAGEVTSHTADAVDDINTSLGNGSSDSGTSGAASKAADEVDRLAAAMERFQNSISGEMDSALDAFAARIHNIITSFRMGSAGNISPRRLLPFTGWNPAEGPGDFGVMAGWETVPRWAHTPYVPPFTGWNPAEGPGDFGFMSGWGDEFASSRNKGKIPLSTWDQGMKTIGSNQFLWSAGGAAASQLMQGGGAGDVAGALLPMVGSAFGPVGTVVGSILGGLFGKKKNRGESKSNPVFVYDVKTEDLQMVLLTITKMWLTGSAGRGGGADLDNLIRAQRAPSYGYS